MNGVRKAAILLLSLDKSLAAQILALLPRDQLEAATIAVARAENPQAEELSSVLVEFKTRLQSKPSLPKRPEMTRQQTVVADEVSVVAVDATPTRTTGRGAAVSAAKSPPPVEISPFDFLTGQHVDDVLQLLQDEQAQTIAVVASQLTPAFSASVLAGLQPDRQADVLQRVARMGPTDPEILSDIAQVLKERLGRPRVRAGGVSHAAAVLRESTKAASRSMLTNLDDQDSGLADELRQTLFSFDDLLKLDDETLRVVLQETDDRQWALALKASPEPVRQKVLSCLPSRVAAAFKVEMDSLGPVRLSEMTTVRQQIADSIHRLEDAGLIVLPVG
jgi:flagellar motor switch protein FliG